MNPSLRKGAFYVNPWDLDDWWMERNASDGRFLRAQRFGQIARDAAASDVVGNQDSSGIYADAGKEAAAWRCERPLKSEYTHTTLTTFGESAVICAVLTTFRAAQNENYLRSSAIPCTPSGKPNMGSILLSLRSARWIAAPIVAPLPRVVPLSEGRRGLPAF
jgi:hypothetical protein